MHSRGANDHSCRVRAPRTRSRKQKAPAAPLAMIKRVKSWRPTTKAARRGLAGAAGAQRPHRTAGCAAAGRLRSQAASNIRRMWGWCRQQARASHRDSRCCRTRRFGTQRCAGQGAPRAGVGPARTASSGRGPRCGRLTRRRRGSRARAGSGPGTRGATAPRPSRRRWTGASRWASARRRSTRGGWRSAGGREGRMGGCEWRR
jgi:hypothetical protein